MHLKSNVCEVTHNGSHMILWCPQHSHTVQNLACRKQSHRAIKQQATSETGTVMRLSQKFYEDQQGLNWGHATLI